ncbi:MAG: PfkB family carbohydrate kinase [Chloroflexota bacterium]|nr:PfkB family carbohydrate kinase [Chloroflexota bacterium]
MRRITLPPFKVDVVDTVGAGDSFSGGFLASLAERGVVTREALERLPLDELERSLRFATAVSALTRTRAGADPPDRAAVDQFLAAQGVDNG